MPWGTSEGGTPQPYRIEVVEAHWDMVRRGDGTLVETRDGENLMSLVFEGHAKRLIEEEDGSFSVGEDIEPLEGKYNRRSFLIGKTSQWTDPRENGEKIESTRGPDEMPWAKSELGRFIESLVGLIGVDALAEWGEWEEAETWKGHTFDIVPTHDTKKDGSPATYTTGDGEERIDWYFIAVAADEDGGGKAKSSSSKGRSSGSRSRRSRGKGDSNGSLEDALKKAFSDFEGDEDEFIDFIETDEFDRSEELAKLSDKDFDELMDKILG